MKYKPVFLTLIIVMLAFLCALPVVGSDMTVSSRYHNEPDPDFPKTVYAGWVRRCGAYEIKLLQDPVLTKSAQHMIADNDTEYLVIRAAITNVGEQEGGWLAPDSFILQDTYRGRIYGSYSLDLPVSAKVASGFKQSVFHAGIKPGETLYTSLVFMVYPDVQSWLFTFAPHQYGEEPEETLRFQLPPVIDEDLSEIPEE